MGRYHIVIHTGVAQDEYQPQEMDFDSTKVAPLLTRSFRHEMELWKERGDMPEWVGHWLPILDILYEKKSYITMSDLIRMIILYYEGGVYLDVKIKVAPDKALFKELPMVKVNTANFYAHENWAIMAHAGYRMLEDMMIQTYRQFPDKTQLRDYPTNYQEASGPEERRREGKMHVELHESSGVWNIIDRRGRPQFPTDLKLQNPRSVNSWADAYDDRSIDVIRAEQRQQREDDLSKIKYKKIQKERERDQKKEQLRLKDAAQLWTLFGITQAIMDGLPNEIKLLELQIRMLQMEQEDLEG